MTRCFDPYPLLPTATSRMAATGGTLPARRAGDSAAMRVMTTPAASDTTTVVPVSTTPPAGTSKPNALEERFETGGHEDAGAEPDERRDDTDRERFEEHRREDLALLRAERAEQRVLACALRDGDVEGVEDDEPADQECDDREDQHELVEEAESLADRVLVLRR